MSTLPEEVVERLSTCGPVRLVTGPEDAPLGVEAHLAPLHRQLYAFVFRGSATEANLLRDGRAEIQADDKAGEWTVRVRGRGVAGRPVLADPRRPELMHWLPEGVSPNQLLAVRLHPETVEYVRGKGTSRNRAAGPVPGGGRPPLLARWGRLASEGVLVPIVAMIVVDFFALFWFEEEERRRSFLLAVMVLAGLALLAAVNLWHAAATFTRWREGLEPDERAGFLLLGWEPPGRVRAVAMASAAFGLLLAGLVGFGAGAWAAVVTVVASWAPLLFPFHLVRHAMRRSDAARERP